MKDFSSILDGIKKASIFDVFLISFLALPFVLEAWTSTLEKIEYQPLEIRGWLNGVVIAYVIGIIIMIIGANRRKNKELARDQVLGYLQGKGFKMMSFEKVRENINKNYNDKFLNSVITEFPDDLRHAKVKGGKLGIARLIEEDEQEKDNIN